MTRIEELIRPRSCSACDADAWVRILTDEGFIQLCADCVRTMLSIYRARAMTSR